MYCIRLSQEEWYDNGKAMKLKSFVVPQSEIPLSLQAGFTVFLHD